MTPGLPSSVVMVETRVDAPESSAWPAESTAVAGLPDARRAEYVTVRDCARQALARLGVPPAPIIDDARGAPVWPRGIVGAMTHCRGYRAAAVARVGDVTALGIDAEPAEALPTGIGRRISADAEWASIEVLTRQDAGVPWDRLLFSAKESVYKAWYPLTRIGLDFLAVDITLQPDGQGHVTFLRDLPDEVAGLQWQLGWQIEDSIIKTAVWSKRKH